MQLAPIPVEVEAPQAASVLNLSNRASSSVALQVRVFRWAQENGEDRLTPTRDVVVSPPIASIPPGQTLTVRVVRTLGGLPAAEETYRIWVDELPSEKLKGGKGQSLRILMRYSVPVFFEPADAARDEPKLDWRLVRANGAEWQLTAGNAGPRRVHVSELQLRDSGTKTAMFAPGSELGGYVLAGQKMRWTLKLPKGFPSLVGGRYGLEYRTEAESHRESVSLVPAR